MSNYNHNSFLNVDPPKTLGGVVFSNLFFEIAPKNTRVGKINEIYNIYGEYLKKNSYKFQFEENKIKKDYQDRVINEINFIYDRINTSEMNSNNGEITDIISKLGEKKKNEEQKEFFSTQITKEHPTTQRYCIVGSSRRQKSVSLTDQIPAEHHENSPITLSSDRRRKIIFIGKRRNKIKRKFRHLGFSELSEKIPYINEGALEKSLENYEMRDKIASMKKPAMKFK